MIIKRGRPFLARPRPIVKKIPLRQAPPKKKITRIFGIKIYLAIFFMILILIFLILFFFNVFIKESFLLCGDGTFNENCSSRKPYFCLNGTLIEKASVCDCPEILTKKGDLCISRYQTNPKNIILKYVLRGEENEIDFVVYKGMVDYISSLPKSIYHSEDEKPSRGDFQLGSINEEEQKELLLPLVTKIQNIANNKEDQVRIAISIVQGIPYGESGKIITLGPNRVNHSRYPYEVLYDMQGVCEGRSELLAFLLKEIGYGVALFYYPLENHEVVGIKCPMKYSLDNTGYCFVETTGVSIITNNQDYYIGWGKLSSEPEMILTLDGISLSNNLYEYKDAKDLIKISKVIDEKGEINFFQHNKLESLRKKYGLEI